MANAGFQIEYMARDGSGPFVDGPCDLETAIEHYNELQGEGFTVRVRNIHGLVLPDYTSGPWEDEPPVKTIMSRVMAGKIETKDEAFESLKFVVHALINDDPSLEQLLESRFLRDEILTLVDALIDTARRAR